MLKYLCAVTFGVSLAVTSSAHAMDGFSDPFDGVYHLVNCATNPARCAAFHATNAAPPANYLDGFNNAAFATYFQGLGFDTSNDDFWTPIKGVTSSGIVYGFVEDDMYMITADFAFQNGQVFCCYLDQPFTINDVNDNGYYVGIDQNGLGYVTFGIDGEAYAGTYSIPTFDAASRAILDSLPLMFPYDWNFLAIDNNNIILAEYYSYSGEDQRYLFVPEALIPEPGSSSMVATGLIAFFLLRKPRSRTFPR